jgi:PAS domain S-box-containing protein
MRRGKAVDARAELVRDLQVWRADVLRGLVLVAAGCAAPVSVFIVIEAVRHPERWPKSWPYLIMHVVVAGLGLIRRVDPRVRAWGLVMLSYAAGVMATAYGGLAGDGRVLLLTVPVLALVLIGPRAGLVLACLSALALAAFGFAADWGLLEGWLVIRDNPLEPSAWLYESVVVAVCLALLVVLQWLFTRFLETLAAEKVRLLKDATESRDRYQTVSELTSDYAYAYRVKPAGGFAREWVTGAFSRITGFTPEELDRRGGWLSLVHPEDRAIVLRHVETYRSDQPDACEYRIIAKGGEVRWLRDHGRPVSDPTQDGVVRIYGAVQDVTGRKLAEAAVRESEETARALLDASSDAMLLLEPDGTIIALNEAAAQRLGRSESHLIGACVFDRFPPDVAAYRRAQCDKAVSMGRPVQFEDQRAGRWFEHSIHPVFDDQGQATRLAINARDVTEQRLATREAARADRLAAMGRMAAALAHEINNPLQAIRSSLELVLDFDLAPAEREQYLAIVRDEIERLAKTTQGVLEFSRPADDTRLPMSVVYLVEQTLALVGRQLRDAEIEVTMDFAPDLPPLMVVPSQITQVLLNLVINAIEAMGHGGHLHMAVHADEEVMVLEVANDGSPIPQEHLERLFEPFFTTKPRGTGLGLPVSHRIIHQHGGTISVENREDEQGTVFTIRLPIVRPARREEKAA